MLNLASVSRLYENVLLHDFVENRISIPEICAGIQSMGHVYSPDSSNFESTVIKFPNFNDTACRCAYLHKYAPLHTFVVQDAMLKIIHNNPSLFSELVLNFKRFEFCSLGGGPGSDVIGVLAALQHAFGSFDSTITIIDCMERWEETFRSIMRELTVGFYSQLSNNIVTDCQWNYIGCNLLSSMTNEVNKSIATASFITMVKFVSAAICTNTEEMVDKIFRVIKPGALVLFIDNAAGGFTQLIIRSSRKNGLFPVFGPLKHVTYEAEALKINRFGYTSCFKTTVTIILLKKPLNPQQIRKYAHSTPNYLKQNVVSPKPPDSLNFVVMDASEVSKANINNSTHSSSGHSSTMKNALLPTPTNLNLNLQTPNSNSTIRQGEVGVTKNKCNSTRSPEYSSNINKLPTKVDNLKTNLQKPSAAVGQKTGDITSARPKSSLSSGHGSLNIDASQATRANVNHSLKNDNSNAAFNQKRSNVASTRSPERSARSADYISHPLSESYVARPATIPRVDYRPVPLQETDDNSEETCCTCCVIS